jgi:putative CocE/NonD family hydrolase
MNPVAGLTHLSGVALAALLLAVAVPAHATDVPDRQAVYIVAAGGVELAVDVRLPAASHGTRVPAMLVMTRYGRRNRLSEAAATALLTHGFAIVLVDMRGAGASFGHVDSIFSADERADIVKVLDWLAAQPWSNGKVVVTGASHDGNLAQLAVASGHPAVVGAVPRFIDFDTYRDLAVPGGVRNETFLKGWGELTQQLDTSEACLSDAAQCARFSNLAPVDGDRDLGRLRAALLDHQRNFHPYRDTQGYAFQDDVGPDGRPLASGYLSAFPSAWRRSRTPELVWGSWRDARTADSALALYKAAPQAALDLVIGPWAHGGGPNLDPLRTGDALGDPNVGSEILAFALDAVSDKPEQRRRIRYYTMGPAIWRETAQWPPAGLSETRLSFGGGGTLMDGEATAGTDRYDVDFSATTGADNRWRTQLGGGAVAYPDRAREDRKLLVYTGEPLAADLEITGSPTADLRLASSRPDGAVFVYLEAVAPDGRVIYLTEGNRRIGFRRSDHFARADFTPPAPGEVFILQVSLATVSAVIPKGWRLRVAIAGADEGTFARYPDAGPATLSIVRGPDGSGLRLPQAPWKPAK